MAAKVKTTTKTVKKDEKKVSADPKVQVVELQKQLMVKRLEFLSGKLKDVHAVKKLRKELARVKTAIRAKELESI